MANRIFLIFLLFFLGTSAAEADTPPLNDMIQAWWQAASTGEIEEMTIAQEPFTIGRDPFEIRLRNKEVAYLAVAEFPRRGRNFSWSAVMVRSALKEVREVWESGDGCRVHILFDSMFRPGAPVGFEVHDLNNDGVSEIVTSSCTSGQGSSGGQKSIVQFDGWTPIVLHKAEFERNDGVYGTEDYRFFSRSVAWKFVDLNGDGVSDLVEEITIEKGRNRRPPVATTSKHKFIFKENAFVKYVDYKKSPKKLTKLKVHG